MVHTLFSILSELVKLRQNEMLKSADTLQQIVERFTNDEVINRVIYMFDYNQDWCKSFPIEDQILERDVDCTLHFLTYIVYLHNKEMMDDDVFGCVEYWIVRAIENKSTISYLDFLCKFAKKNNVKCPFQMLIDYGVKKNKLPKSFNR